MFRITLAICLLLALPVVAQDNQTKISASFYAFAYSPDHKAVFLPSGDGGAFEEIGLSTANIVGPVSSVVTDGKLTVHSAPVTGDDGKVTHPVIASSTVKGDIRKALVVLFPTPKGDAMRYRCVVLNHDLADFPLGVYRVMNLTDKPIRGAIGKDVVKALPGGVANLALKGTPGSIVPLRFQYYEEERWNRLTESRAAVRNDRRWLLCIYQDPSNGRMNIRSIPDQTKPAADKEAAIP